MLMSEDIVALAGGVPALHPERKGQLNRSPLKNWIEKNGGLPTYINSVATALLREHPEWGISRVIATAVNWAKKVCATGRAFGGKVKVGKAVRAAACAAVASWERKKNATDEIDDAIIAASDDGSIAQINAMMRKAYRQEERTIIEAIQLSDDEYFLYVLGEEGFTLSDEGGEEDYVEDIDAFMHVMELSAAAQTAIRVPLNIGEGHKVSDSRYKKEILKVGELVVNTMTGKKFNFTPDFLKELKNNFDQKPIDYVPLLYTENGEVHASNARPDNYGGVVEELELDDPDNPTSLLGTFKLTEATSSLVDHNPKYGVSVTVHPRYVDRPRNKYYGPTLLDVAATHKPKFTKMGEWSRVAVKASDDTEEMYEVMDLSDSEFITPEGVEQEEVLEINDQQDKEEEMTETVELTDEQRTDLFNEFMNSEAFKNAVSTAVASKDEEITRLSNEMSGIKEKSYEQTVRNAVDSYRSAGVPPVMIDLAEKLLLSFPAEERDTTIKLSDADGNESEVLRVKVVTDMLENAKGFINLSDEAGSSEEPEEGSLTEEDSEAVNFLAELSRNGG